MIYTDLTKKALQIAYEAHKDQVDKSGVPYIFHPYEVASHMDTEESVCVALLHDVVEDTALTFEDIRKEGFSEEILQALQLLTHDKGVPYMDYIAKIKTSPLARKVKLADLRHNSDWSRLDVIDGASLKRREKYQKAIEMLGGLEQY